MTAFIIGFPLTTSLLSKTYLWWTDWGCPATGKGKATYRIGDPLVYLKSWSRAYWMILDAAPPTVGILKFCSRVLQFRLTADVQLSQPDIPTKAAWPFSEISFQSSGWSCM